MMRCLEVVLNMAMLLLNNESVVPGDAGHGQDLYLLSNSIILILSKNIRLKLMLLEVVGCIGQTAAS